MLAVLNKRWIKPPEHLKYINPYIQAAILKQIDQQHI